MNHLSHFHCLQNLAMMIHCMCVIIFLIFISLQLVDYLDPDGKGFVTEEYVHNLSVDQMKEVLLFIDPTDVSNTEELEYSHIDAGYIE